MINDYLPHKGNKTLSESSCREFLDFCFELQNKCLMQLTQKVGNLKIEFLKRGELIQELKFEKQQKECMIVYV